VEKSREQKIVELLTELNGQTDRELTDKIYGAGKHASSVNAECNYLVQQNKLIRKKEKGLFRNYLVGSFDQNDNNCNCV
jgi:hypothetical protein